MRALERTTSHTMFKTSEHLKTSSPEVVEVEFEGGAIASFPLSVNTVLALGIGTANTEEQLLVSKVVCGPVKITGAMVLDDSLGGLDIDVSIEVLEGGGEGQITKLAGLGMFVDVHNVVDDGHVGLLCDGLVSEDVGRVLEVLDGIHLHVGWVTNTHPDSPGTGDVSNILLGILLGLGILEDITKDEDVRFTII